MKLLACVIGVAAAALGRAGWQGEVGEMGVWLVLGLLGVAVWMVVRLASWFLRTFSWTLLLLLAFCFLMPSLTGSG